MINIEFKKIQNIGTFTNFITGTSSRFEKLKEIGDALLLNRELGVFKK